MAGEFADLLKDSTRLTDRAATSLGPILVTQQLAEARSVSLKRHGAGLIEMCPFHSDHEPSLVITPSKNLWRCLGACRAGGSVIDWVMRVEGVASGTRSSC